MISLLLASIWALSFEEVVYHSAPLFHDRNVNVGFPDDMVSTRAPSGATSAAPSVIASDYANR